MSKMKNKLNVINRLNIRKEKISELQDKAIRVFEINHRAEKS